MKIRPLVDENLIDNYVQYVLAQDTGAVSIPTRQLIDMLSDSRMMLEILREKGNERTRTAVRMTRWLAEKLAEKHPTECPRPIGCGCRHQNGKECKAGVYSACWYSAAFDNVK